MPLSKNEPSSSPPSQEQLNSMYSNTPLSENCRKIRVVHLHAAKRHDDPLHCHLTTTVLPEGPIASVTNPQATPDKSCPGPGRRIEELDPASGYQALSYQWGSEDNPLIITIDDISFRVTQNLHLALIYLRDKTRTRVLWVDAICINQTDDKEKTEQLKLMADIYLRADSTVVWLGTGSFLSREGIHSLKVTAMAARRGLEGTAEKYRPSADEEAALEAQRSTRRKMLEKLAPQLVLFMWRLATVIEVLKMRYFTRMWVVQEQCLGRRLDIVCREHHLTLTDLVLGSVAVNISGLGAQVTRNLFNVLIARSLLPWSPTCGIEDPSFIARTVSRSSLWIEGDEGGARSGGFVTLLSIFRQSQAKDPRDKVFGLLGLCENICPGSTFGVEAAYVAADSCVNGKGAVHVNHVPTYTAATCSIIWGQKTLGHLGALVASRQRANELPSWVPDWSHSDAVPPQQILSTNKNFCASGGRNFVGSMHSPWIGVGKRSPAILIIYGHLLHFEDKALDKIEVLSSVCDTETAQKSTRFKIRIALGIGGFHREEQIRNWAKALGLRPIDAERKHFLSTLTACPRQKKLSDADRADFIRILHRVRQIAIPPPSLLKQVFLHHFHKWVYGALITRTVLLARRPSLENLGLAFLWWSATLGSLSVFYVLLFNYVPNLRRIRDGGCSSFLREKCLAMETRAMGRLTSGRLALVPASAKAGDVILFCKGSNVPLVVRQKEGHGCGFHMVGECFVREAMDGTLFREDECRPLEIH